MQCKPSSLYCQPTDSFGASDTVRDQMEAITTRHKEENKTNLVTPLPEVEKEEGNSSRSIPCQSLLTVTIAIIN